jgi:hypothetical protein
MTGPSQNALLLYCGAIKELCDYARATFDEMVQTKDSLRRYFLAITVVSTASDISKFFRPTAPRRKSPRELKEYTKQRAKALRDKYGINESDPFLSRNLRDHFEHYDERLDEFILERGNASMKQLLEQFKGFVFEPGRPDIIRFRDQTEVNVEALKSWIDGIWNKSVVFLDGTVSKRLEEESAK